MKADVGTTTSSGPGSNGTAALARCVAWCPRDASGDLSLPAPPPAKLPKELRELLAPRASSVECHAEPLDALAAMVLHERGFVSGAHKEPMLLILVEPARLVGVDALVAAMSKYAHRAAVWQYDPASPKRLSRYTAPVDAPAPNGTPNGHTVINAHAATAAPRARTVAGTAPAFVSWVGMPGPINTQPNGGRPAPRLRLAGEPPAAPTAANATPSPAARPALTDEEMAMLLGDAPPCTNGVKP